MASWQAGQPMVNIIGRVHPGKAALSLVELHVRADFAMQCSVPDAVLRAPQATFSHFS